MGRVSPREVVQLKNALEAIKPIKVACQQDVLLSCGGMTFDTRSRTAAVNGQTLTLTRKETGILEYLMVHQGRPVSQKEHRA